VAGDDVLQGDGERIRHSRACRPHACNWQHASCAEGGMAAP
jgi:hypothetical protein